MFKTLKRFLFDYRYFSRAEFDQTVDKLARDSASRTTRGNVSVQDGRFVTEKDMTAEAKAPSC